MSEMEKEQQEPELSGEVNENFDGAAEEAQEETAQEEGAQQMGDGDDSPETKEDAKALKKKEKAERKKDKSKEKIAELEDKVKRQLAEFENFRNRTEKEKTMMFDMGVKSVIEKILPVVDNFERGLMAVPEEEKDGAFCDGMNKIYKQLMTELDAIGVKAIEAVGTEFNPELHNAVMQVESEEYESGTVAEELQKGYTYHDSVVRHSMVSVVS